MKGKRITERQRATFLAEYAACGSLTRAAGAAGVSRAWVYNERDRNADFAAELEEAHSIACDHLMAEARRRAVDGVEEPVFYQGVQCGSVQRYSDKLLAMLLKGLMPEVFRERIETRHTGADGGTLRIVEEIIVEAE